MVIISDRCTTKEVTQAATKKENLTTKQTKTNLWDQSPNYRLHMINKSLKKIFSCKPIVVDAFENHYNLVNM